MKIIDPIASMYTSTSFLLERKDYVKYLGLSD